MWQLPREVFDLDIENLKKVKRMKKTREGWIYSFLVQNCRCQESRSGHWRASTHEVTAADSPQSCLRSSWEVFQTVSFSR